MTGHTPIPHEALRRLRRPLALTRIGMAAERGLRSFWPFISVSLAVLAAMMLGALDAMPLEVAWFGLIISLAALGVTLWRGLRAFRWPSAEDALQRLDSTLPGRPISAITDDQAIGSGDADSVAVWRAHVRRMADRVRRARAPRPNLRIAALDPYALRYAALLAFVVAALFGSFWRVADMAELADGGVAADIAAGPVWEGWVEPPAYTGRPSLYLNDVPPGALRVPQGSRISLRFYGEVGALTVRQTVAEGPTVPPSELVA